MSTIWSQSILSTRRLVTSRRSKIDKYDTSDDYSSQHGENDRKMIRLHRGIDNRFQGHNVEKDLAR